MTKVQLHKMRRLLVSLKRDLDEEGGRMVIDRVAFEPIWEGMVTLLEEAEEAIGRRGGHFVGGGCCWFVEF